MFALGCCGATVWRAAPCWPHHRARLGPADKMAVSQESHLADAPSWSRDKEGLDPAPGPCPAQGQEGEEQGMEGGSRA